jgi:hypothetical protein
MKLPHELQKFSEGRRNAALCSSQSRINLEHVTRIGLITIGADIDAEARAITNWLDSRACSKVENGFAKARKKI